MTIGLAALGPGAGRAVLDALAAVEAVGRGAIGGFGVFVAAAAGRAIAAETQRGGCDALHAALERSGGAAALSGAGIAAVISSGPDRPTPLSQFLAADPAVGLVTGHRLPNSPGADGRPVNQAVLAALRAGAAPAAAVQRVLAANPEVDAGMIAVTDRDIALANSTRVARRPDLGQALLRDAAGWAVACLHNSIRPQGGLAALAAATAGERLAAASPPLPSLRLRPGTPVAPGPADRVLVDRAGVVLRVESANPAFPPPAGFAASAVYPGSQVLHEGRLIGYTVGEVRGHCAQGRLVGFDAPAEIAYRPLTA